MTDVSELVRTAVPQEIPELDYGEVVARGRRRRRGRIAMLAVAPVLALTALISVGWLIESGPEVAYDPVAPREHHEWVPFVDRETGIMLRHPPTWQRVVPPTARGIDHVVTVVSPGVDRGDFQRGCEQDPSAGWPADGAVMRVYDRGSTPVDATSTRPSKLDLDEGAALRACNGDVQGWQFQFIHNARHVSVILYIGRNAGPAVTSDALRVLNTVTVEDRRPTEPVDKTVAHLRRAHEHMNDALTRMGGLQSWSWAVLELDEALAGAEGAEETSHLVDDIRRLRDDSAAVLVNQERLMHCASVLNRDARDQDPVGYDRCYEEILTSRHTREALHSRLTQQFGSLMGLDDTPDRS